MKRKEAEKQILAEAKKSCRGWFTPGAAKLLKKRLETERVPVDGSAAPTEMEKAGAAPPKFMIEKLSEPARRCLGAVLAIPKETKPDVFHETVRRLRGKLVAPDVVGARLFDDLLREPCGKDLRPTIAKGPLDGQKNTGTCPGCGLTFQYRTERFEIDG